MNISSALRQHIQEKSVAVLSERISKVSIPTTAATWDEHEDRGYQDLIMIAKKVIKKERNVEVQYKSINRTYSQGLRDSGWCQSRFIDLYWTSRPQEESNSRTCQLDFRISKINAFVLEKQDTATPEH
jgi:hypothetical protein